MSKPPFAILAAGGTGGHMFPAQSLAEVLEARGWEVALTTDDRGMRYAKGFSDETEKIILPAGSFAQGSMLKRMLVPFRILEGVRTAWKVFSRTRPQAVIGFGGYPALPALIVARLRGIPYFIHEQNAVLGRVNKLFHKGAQKVACGIWPVVHAGENAVFLGNPVRGNVQKLEATALPKTGPKTEKIGIVVFGGSQGASVLSRIVPPALAALPEDLRQKLHITQQAREGEIDEVKAIYQAANINAEIAPFFKDLPERIAASHFVIARSGASTLAEIQLIGRGSILVPLPSAANDHQRLNAKAMVQAGAALEFDEAKNNVQDLAKWIEDVLSVKGKLAQMADAAYGLARPDAVEALADLIEKEMNHD